MVFQNYALYPHMSVEENMAWGLKIRGMGKGLIAERVQEAARILELDGLLKRRPRELSGGQRQRVAMGRAIAEGSAGQEVGQVERWINRRAQLSCGEGYVADNNRFGASDAAAVRAVQQQAGLQPVNGIVYRETWHALQAQCTDPCGCEKEE